MEYPKINSLWKREGWYFEEGKKNSPNYQKGKHSFIVGDYAKDEFANIKKWHVEEKIDGTNLRIIYEDGKVRFGGRTDDSQIPCHLYDYLQNTFGDWNLGKQFPEDKDRAYPKVILFGEGFSPKIQNKGGNYSDQPGFILFDAWIEGWWVKRESVKNIANEMGLYHCPWLGTMTEEEIVEFVKSKPKSRFGEWNEKEKEMEGVVCRPDPLMLDRESKPIIFKLKTKDFKGIENEIPRRNG